MQQAYAADTLCCLDVAKKEATSLFVALADGKLEPGTTQQSIVHRCNKKYKLAKQGRPAAGELLASLSVDGCGPGLSLPVRRSSLLLRIPHSARRRSSVGKTSDQLVLASSAGG